MQVRYITNHKEKEQILEDCHCDATSGHMGIKKTLARITERFIWAGVAEDVCSLVSKLYIFVNYFCSVLEIVLARYL